MKLYSLNKGKTWGCWDPLKRKVVSLGSDKAVAEEKMRRIWEQSGAPSNITVPESKPLTNPEPRPVTNSADIMASWVKSNPIAEPKPATEAPKPDSFFKPSGEASNPVTSVSGNGQSGNAATPVNSLVPIRKKHGLTPEQAAKIGTGMKRIVTKINVVCLNVCVSYLGRDPFPVADDELELMAIGWEMMLEEYFVKHQPKPWMLIAAGNMLVGFSMYMRGKPFPKKDKKVELANASPAGN
jgi:hypothetical protein